MIKTTNKAAFEILLFDMKIDNAASCTRVLALSTQKELLLRGSIKSKIESVDSRSH